MSELIKPLATALPFFRVSGSYAGIQTSDETPFYFQRNQCLNDCNYGTITDRKHLPSFIIRVPKDHGLNNFSEFTSRLLCVDNSNSIDIVPVFQFDVIAIVNLVELAIIEAAGPNIADAYYLDNNDLSPIVIMTWDGATFQSSGQITPTCPGLLNVSSEELVYSWKEDINSTQPEPARQGEWVPTNQGYLVCNIGDETYFIYNGFEVEELPCGIRQIQVRYGLIDPGPEESQKYYSELVDVRDFDVDNNVYHKLEITNNCALGNIPYEDICFKQLFYFDERVVVGEPVYDKSESKQEDGLGNEKLLFSRVRKVFLLDTEEVPEYIVDYLSFATQHKTIHITFPKEGDNASTFNNHYKGKRRIDSDNMEIGVDWGVLGCFAQLEVTFSLLEDTIKTACCQTLDKDGCIITSFTIKQLIDAAEQANIESLPPAKGDCYLITSGTPGPSGWPNNIQSVACWNGTDWAYTAPTVNLLVITNTFFRFIYSEITGMWHSYLGVEEFSTNSIKIDVKSFSPVGTTTILFYRKQGDALWIKLVELPSESMQEFEVSATGLTPSTNYEFRVLALNNNCNYGYGPIKTISTDVDPFP